MQRFKKELLCAYLVGASATLEKKTRMLLASNSETYKFIYGANGTLTQAALYRLTAIVNAARYPGDGVASYRKHLAAVRHMMDCARRGGCYLP